MQDISSINKTSLMSYLEGNMMNRNKALVIVLVLLILNITPVQAAKVESNEVSTHYCTGGNSLEDSFEDEGSLNILNTLVFSAEVNTGFFVGSEFPLLFELTFPNQLYQDCDFGTFVRSEGLPDARIGIEAHADIKATVTLQEPVFGTDIFTWNLIDWTESLNLLAEFDKTPIGEVVTDNLEAKVKVIEIPLYFEVLGVPVINTKITAYLGMTADVTVGCETSAKLGINSNSLVDSFNREIVWDEDNVTYYRTSTTLASAKDSVSIGLSELQLELTTYVIEITSFFLELELKDMIPVKLPILIPDNLLSINTAGLTSDLDTMDSVIVPMIVPEDSMSFDPSFLILFGGLAVVVVLIIIVSRR